MGKKMFFWILLYILCSAFGLVLIKMGVNQGMGLSIKSSTFQFQMGILVPVGLVLYVTSFLLSIFVMSKMNLSYFYPISAGMIYIVVCIASFILLKEAISRNALIGMACILLGVFIINMPSKH